MEEDETKFVVCKVCGKKLARIDNHHLRIHHMTKLDYIRQFGINNMVSDEYHVKQSQASIESNTYTTFH